MNEISPEYTAKTKKGAFKMKKIIVLLVSLFLLCGCRSYTEDGIFIIKSRYRIQNEDVSFSKLKNKDTNVYHLIFKDGYFDSYICLFSGFNRLKYDLIITVEDNIKIIINEKEWVLLEKDEKRVLKPYRPSIGVEGINRNKKPVLSITYDQNEPDIEIPIKSKITNGFLDIPFSIKINEEKSTLKEDDLSIQITYNWYWDGRRP